MCASKGEQGIALPSAVLVFGRREGMLEVNPCRDKYNKTCPHTRYVTPAKLDLVMRIARERGWMYVVAALCLRAAYLTISRPDEMRQVMRQAITEQGVELAMGKRKKGQAQKFKLIEWSADLRAVFDEALKLQRTSSLYVFGNSDGQPYTTSGWNTKLRRLMVHAEKAVPVTSIFLSKIISPTQVTFTGRLRRNTFAG